MDYQEYKDERDTANGIKGITQAVVTSMDNGYLPKFKHPAIALFDRIDEIETESALGMKTPEIAAFWMSVMSLDHLPPRKDIEALKIRIMDRLDKLQGVDQAEIATIKMEVSKLHKALRYMHNDRQYLAPVVSFMRKIVTRFNKAARNGDGQKRMMELSEVLQMMPEMHGKLAVYISYVRNYLCKRNTRNTGKWNWDTDV